MDSVTKWLVRVASSIIILFTLVLIIAIPVLTFKLTSGIDIARELVKTKIDILLQVLLG